MTEFAWHVVKAMVAIGLSSLVAQAHVGEQNVLFEGVAGPYPVRIVILKFGGGPVGVSSLAVAVGEEPDTIEEVHEPYLIMEGFLKRTPQGRVATELSYRKLGLKTAGTTQPRFL